MGVEGRWVVYSGSPPLVPRDPGQAGAHCYTGDSTPDVFYRLPPDTDSLLHDSRINPRELIKMAVMQSLIAGSLLDPSP